MNDEKELIRLGFVKNSEGNYSLAGKHQTFIAYVIDCNVSVYSTIHYQSKEIDSRPQSTRKGLPYINKIKDCCSRGSVERAIAKYDVEDKYIRRNGYSFEILN